MTQTMDLEGLAARLAEEQGAARRVVAVAGPPGSGKSTFAERLHAALASRVAAEVLPMDGYHYDDIVLEARGHRPRKGAPHTFDVDGFGAMLARLRADDGRDVAVPVFDRSIEIARAGARIVPAATRLVIAEGNYLLLDDPDWTRLRRYFDATVFLRVPEDELTHTPFFHRSDVAAVTAYREGGKLAGATVTWKPVDGLTADWMRVALMCHRARLATLGYPTTYMAYDPSTLNATQLGGSSWRSPQRPSRCISRPTRPRSRAFR